MTEKEIHNMIDEWIIESKKENNTKFKDIHTMIEKVATANKNSFAGALDERRRINDKAIYERKRIDNNENRISKLEIILPD